MYKLLLTVILPTAPISRPRRAPEDRPAGNPAGQNAREQALQRRASFLSASHLFNPLVFTISTRGSSEAVLSLLVLLTLYSALKRRWDAAAILLGLSTHWKIYPFIYGVSCLGVIGSETGAGKGWKGYLGQILNLRTLRFGLLSAATFFSLGALMYYMQATFISCSPFVFLTSSDIDGAIPLSTSHTCSIFIASTIDITSRRTFTSST